MSQQHLTEAEYDAITDAAAQWCMRLHAADCTAAERQAFEQWRDAHPLHAFEYEAMQEIWEVADHLPRPPTSTVVPLPAPRRSWRAYGMAAAISALACPGRLRRLGLGWLPSSYEHFQADGSMRQVTLADGSQVELNLGTELTYSNYKDQRRVTLKKAKPSSRSAMTAPIRSWSAAASGEVRVTGTQFNVWMYEDQVRVILLEGSVLVNSDNSRPDGGFRLDPGMQARYRRGDYQPQISQTYANDSSLAWRQGKLVLDNLASARPCR